MKNFKDALLIIVAISLVILSAGLFSAKEKEKSQKNASSVKLAVLRGSLNRIQDEFRTKEKIKIEAEKKLDDLTREASALEIQIEQIKKIYDASETQLAETESSIYSMRQAIKSIAAEKEGLIAEITSAQQDSRDMGDRLTLLQQAKNALKSHLQSMMRTAGMKEAASVDKKPQQVKPEPVVAEAAPEPEPVASADKIAQSGEVLVVNREFNFVVINLGKKDGIKEGDRFMIYDVNRPLGEVSVETVRENISAASGGKNLDAYRLRAGNKVIKY
ncbi:MAG: hypothetical protein JW946_00870 [Candidatus Omnitrophica bacterium]|nr:hypothetical protein [Candidatus Omnitrophota bacterium]